MCRLTVRMCVRRRRVRGRRTPPRCGTRSPHSRSRYHCRRCIVLSIIHLVHLLQISALRHLKVKHEDRTLRKIPSTRLDWRQRLQHAVPIFFPRLLYYFYKGTIFFLLINDIVVDCRYSRQHVEVCTWNFRLYRESWHREMSACNAEMQLRVSDVTIIHCNEPDGK